MYAFFFFKQKTAYERRISDWSSDVCASDLAGAAHHRVIGFAHVGTECADEVEMLAGLQPVAADQRLLRQRGAGDDVGAACGGFQIVGPVDAEVAAIHALGEALRSEEHTSELQSLMRITYAVFWL